MFAYHATALTRTIVAEKIKEWNDCSCEITSPFSSHLVRWCKAPDKITQSSKEEQIYVTWENAEHNICHCQSKLMWSQSIMKTNRTFIGIEVVFFFFWWHIQVVTWLRVHTVCTVLFISRSLQPATSKLQNQLHNHCLPRVNGEMALDGASLDLCTLMPFDTVSLIIGHPAQIHQDGLFTAPWLLLRDQRC